jgi:hypothetical protein
MIKVLLLAANPRNTSRLRIDEEAREIDHALQRAEYRAEFDLKQHWATRITDIQELLLRYQPDIVHLSGHGSAESRIILEDNTGDSAEVPPGALARLFVVAADHVRCVVLNACYSEDQARAIAENVDCVIGMSKAVGDRSAISFSGAFYQALGYGRDLKTAFDLTCVQLELEASNYAEVPSIIYQNDDAPKLILAPSRSFPLTVRPPEGSGLDANRLQTTASDVTIAQFTVDETKSRFRAYYYDQAREIYPSNWVTFNPGGAVEAFGKKFKSGEEYYSYADDLRRRTNHYLFSWLIVQVRCHSLLIKEGIIAIQRNRMTALTILAF